MKKSNRFWALVLAVLVALAAAACLLIWYFGRGGTVAHVYLDGELVRSIDLAQVEEGYTFSVEGPVGTNTIQVEPGHIRVSHADCPDQVCVGQGWISTSAAPIVCLPNRLVIEITTGSAQKDLDAVTGG